MIQDISVVSWLQFFISFLLFLGPGYAFLSFFVPQFWKGVLNFSNVFWSFVLSIGFWVLILLWFRVINLKVTPVIATIICILGWVVFLFRNTFLLKSKSLPIPRPDKFDYLELFLFALCCVAALFGYRHEIAGLGSDSFHHTLIAQMIFTQGKIPENYLPYAPIISFTYHYGFHALIAVFGWLSGWPLRLLVIVSGPILIAMMGYAIGLMVYTLTKSRAAELTAFVAVSFLAVFPAFMLNWGRYPQLLGTILMIALIIRFIKWRENNFSLGEIPWIVILALGLALSHYRITILCAIGLALYLMLETFFDLDFRKKLLQYARPLIWTVIICLVLVSPWLFNYFLSRQQGVSFTVSIPTESEFYSPSRLGNEPNQYPTNWLLFTASFLSAAVGLWKKNRYTVWVLLWWSLLFVFSDGMVLGRNFDRVTYYISLFVPIGLLCGFLIAEFVRSVHQSWWLKVVGLLFGTGLLIWGVTLSARIAHSSDGYAHASDLEALHWIETNTPADAIFMINTYNFPFSNRVVIGSDAGYWLPVLADRKTVVPPMSYQTERLSSTDMFENLILLHQLNGHLASNHAVQLLRNLGVSYVYIGSRGGIIQPDELLASPDYKLEYENNSNFVFLLLPK